MTGEGYQISYGATFFGIGTSTSTAYDNTVTIRFDVGNGVTAPAPPEGLVWLWCRRYTDDTLCVNPR